MDAQGRAVCGKDFCGDPHLSAAPCRVKGQRHLFLRGIYAVDRQFPVAHGAVCDGHLSFLSVLVGKGQARDQDKGQKKYSPGSVSGHMVHPKLFFLIL